MFKKISKILHDQNHAEETRPVEGPARSPYNNKVLKRICEIRRQCPEDAVFDICCDVTLTHKGKIFYLYVEPDQTKEQIDNAVVELHKDPECVEVIIEYAVDPEADHDRKN